MRFDGLEQEGKKMAGKIDTEMTEIRYGDFVRVRKDAEFRAGQDGMVAAPPDGDGELGMVFYYDRYGNSVRSTSITGNSFPTPCEGIEAWNVAELDLATLER